MDKKKEFTKKVKSYSASHERIYKDFEFSYTNIKKYIDIWKRDAMVMEAMTPEAIEDNYKNGHNTHYTYLIEKYNSHARWLKDLSNNMYSQANLIKDMDERLQFDLRGTCNIEDRLPEAIGGAKWVHVIEDDKTIKFLDLHVTNTGDIVNYICSGLNLIGFISKLTASININKDYDLLTEREKHHVGYLANFCKYDLKVDCSNNGFETIINNAHKRNVFNDGVLEQN